MPTLVESKTRNIDLVNSPAGTKFFILSRQDDISITTYDRELNSKNNVLVPEYYSFQKIDGRDQYKHKFTVPNFIKRSSDYMLLMDLKTSRGDTVLVYLDKISALERSILTVLNPQDDLSVVVHPGGIIEVVFIDPENPLSVPSVDQTNSAFELEFLRREVVHDRDDILRPYNKLFDIRRWIINTPQCHFFFRVNPRNYEMLSRGNWEGQMYGPTIKFNNSGKEANLKVKVYINKKIQKEISEFPKERSITVLNQAVTYGLETGMFGGAQVMSRASKNILIDKETGFQEIEVPVPGFDFTQWPKKPLNFTMNRYEPFNITGRIQPNGFRIVNRTFLQKFLVISDMARNCTDCETWSPIGTAEFKFDDDVYSWPVYVGKVENNKAKLSLKYAESEKREREEKTWRTKQVIHDLSSVHCYRKPMVAREVKLIKIENNNQLFSEKQKVIRNSTERIIEDPVDFETINLFPTESLTIRMTNQVIKWNVSSWPTFLYADGRKFYKNMEEFKFGVSCFAAFPKNPVPMLLESGKVKRKIFIKIIT